MPIKAAATRWVARGSGQRGRGTLEECGTNVVPGCKSVVLQWLVETTEFEERGEEEDGDEEEDESWGVMIGCVGDQGEEEDNDCGEEREGFPAMDFWVSDHRWVECIAEHQRNGKNGRAGVVSAC